MFNLKITERTKLLLEPYIEPGDLVIDATLGNGNDAEFLYSCVKEEGVVIGLDIQQEAIKNSLNLFKDIIDLESISLDMDDLKKVNLWLFSHERIDALKLPKNPKVIVFNLGYLPGSAQEENHGSKELKISTKTETTLKALCNSCDLLQKKGVLSIVTYPGHGEGQREHEAVMSWLKGLQAKEFEVLTITQTNRSIKTPVQHLVMKK